MAFNMVMDSFIVGRTGKTRQVRGTIRFWKTFTQHEVIVESYDTNYPRNRSQRYEWRNESEKVLEQPLLKTGY
jgi:hypothetical protein